MKNYKIIKTTSKIMIGFSVLSVLSVAFATNFFLSADTIEINTDDPCLKLDYAKEYPGLCTSRISNVGSLLDRGLEFLEYFLGTLALLGFIIAGIQFGMSQGTPEKAAKAKKAMIYTAVGIIIAVLSLILTKSGFYLMTNNPT